MKFGSFKEFRNDSSEIGEIVSYLRNELASSLRELTSGLKRLTFANNIQSFTTTVIDLAPQAEAIIQNQLIDNRTRVIPSGYLLIKSKSGNDSNGNPLVNNVPVNIVVGDTQWTTDYLYLKNVGSQNATLQ
jgi:hypothetical protein